MDKVTIRGRLTGDPEIKFVPSGDAVTGFTVAVNDRKKNEAGEWVDGDTMYMPVSAWRNLGESAADQLEKGSLVVVVGRLVERRWEKDGQKRSRIEMVADDIGVSVRARKPVAAASSEGLPW